MPKVECEHEGPGIVGYEIPAIREDEILYYVCLTCDRATPREIEDPHLQRMANAAAEGYNRTAGKVAR